MCRSWNLRAATDDDLIANCDARHWRTHIDSVIAPDGVAFMWMMAPSLFMSVSRLSIQQAVPTLLPVDGECSRRQWRDLQPSELSERFRNPMSI